MVAVGLSSIVMLGIVSMMDLLNKNNTRQGLIQTRGEIISKIRVQSLHFDNLKASAELTQTLGVAGLTPDVGSPNSIPHFDMLAKCMPEFTDSAAVGCDKTAMDVANLGNQFYLADNQSTDPNRAVAGEDVYYRSNGIRCDQATAANVDACPIMARVWFEPYCLNFANTCNKAMSLAVRYAVGGRDGTSIQKIALLEGEVYIPVQKGIQLSRLMNENDVPIASNSQGIFSVQKYYGSEMAAGLRFEAIISNPTGLVSMKIQKREITGPDAKNYGEDVVPTALETAAWQDVPTPNNAALGAWAINLANGRPNQIFNFGTQANVTSNSRTPTSFTIGSADPNNANFRWTRNAGTGQYQAPVFKSGVYQFRIVAQDSVGTWVESTNYFTVRIIGKPEALFVNQNFYQQRDCVAGSYQYNILVGDDENVSQSTIKLNNVDLGVSQINGDHGSFAVPFDLSQVAGTYSLSLTVKNPLSEVALESFTVPSLTESRMITLVDVAPQFQTLTNTPTKIRINTTGTISASYVTGNCCVQSPTVSWSYPAPAAFGNVPLISGDATSTTSCNISGNSRTCTSSVVATGEKEGPTGNTIADIMATLAFSGTPSDACKMPAASYYSQSKYVPVVKNPTISFYLTESLWLTIPPGSAKATTPRVVVRSDFAPEETVKVQVVKASDSSVVCDVQFDGSATPGASIDNFCNIPVGFSGDLMLQKHPDFAAKIQYDGEVPPAVGPNPFKARLTGNLVHRTCSGNVTSLPDQPPLFTVSSSGPLDDSPWGYTLDASGNKVQDTTNDTGKWTSGSAKNLRCYDAWNTFTDANNQQDYYALYKYNTEDRLPYQPLRHNGIGTLGAPLKYSTFIFPGNPPLIVDPTSKNIPYLYAVYQDGASPSSMVWQYQDPLIGSAAQTSPQAWEDVTGQVCAGVGTLTKVKLFRTLMSVQSNSGNIIMKATNGIFSSQQTGATHSYTFMCEYGRWHPSGKTSVNWIN
jgi:hypothetical protein